MKTPEEVVLTNENMKGVKKGGTGFCPVCDKHFTNNNGVVKKTCSNGCKRIFMKALAIYNSKEDTIRSLARKSLSDGMNDANHDRWVSKSGDFVRGCDDVLGF